MLNIGNEYVKFQKIFIASCPPLKVSFSVKEKEIFPANK